MSTVRFKLGVLKELACFETVLSRYGVAVEGSGEKRMVCCPFHDDSNPSCGVHLGRNIFNCFACGASGNILDFVMKMEDCDIRDAAVSIARWCDINRDVIVEGKASYRGNGKHKPIYEGVEMTPPELRKPPTEEKGVAQTRKETNKPLPFTLDLYPDHEYLKKRISSADLIKTFGLGYCSKGTMEGRICIPIHNEKGELVAYAGRWASKDIPEGVKRYLLPAKFRKSHVLFNLHRVMGTEHIVLVESYWSVIRLHGMSVPSAGLMGRTISYEQIDLLSESGVRVVTLLLDGDYPGRKATEDLVPVLANEFHVRAQDLPKGTKPHSVDEDILRECVTLS